VSSGNHDYPHDHWCSWREVYVKAEDELQKAYRRIANLEADLKDAGSALSQAEAAARAYQDDLRDARAEARHGW
jgi:chromosome segregation ATPase